MLSGGYVVSYLFLIVEKPESLTFSVRFDLQGQGQWPPQTIGMF